MTASNYNVQIHIENRLLSRQFEAIVAQKPKLSVQKAMQNGRTDLLILELNSDPDHTFEQVQDLLNNEKVSEIFLTSESTDQNMLIKAMRSGAREFFGPYTEQEEILAALDRFLSRQAKIVRHCEEHEKSSQIITVMGSKGGVGTTTVAVNLAVSLATMQPKQSVALLDMNLFGDIPLFLEIEPSYTWREITKNISRLDSTFLKNILAVDPSGVHVLPSPGYLDSQNMATPEIIERLFKVMSMMYDFVIIDSGQLLNDPALKIVELSDKLFLVAVQSLPCLANTNKIMRTFRDVGFPDPGNIHIILNRYLNNSNINMEDVENSLHKKVFWSIPNDYLTTVSAINKGQPLGRAAPKKEISKNFKELAKSQVQSAVGAKKKRRWLFF